MPGNLIEKISIKVQVEILEVVRTYLIDGKNWNNGRDVKNYQVFIYGIY